MGGSTGVIVYARVKSHSLIGFTAWLNVGNPTLVGYRGSVPRDFKDKGGVKIYHFFGCGHAYAVQVR